MQKCGINLRRDQLQQIMNDLEEEGEKLRLFVLSTRCQKHCIRKMYKLTLNVSIQHYAILHRQRSTNILPGVQHHPEGTSIGSDNWNFLKVSDFNGSL